MWGMTCLLVCSTGYNKGYAFVNFTTSTALQKFHLAAQNKAWPHFSSSKICQIAYANIQVFISLLKQLM